MFSCNSPCNPTGKQFLLGSIKMFVCLFVFVQKKKTTAHQSNPPIQSSNCSSHSQAIFQSQKYADFHLVAGPKIVGLAASGGLLAPSCRL